MNTRCHELIRYARRSGVAFTRIFNPVEEMAPRLDLAAFSTARLLVSQGQSSRYRINMVNPDDVPIRTVLSIEIIPLTQPGHPYAIIRQPIAESATCSHTLLWDFDWVDACTMTIESRPLPPAAILLNRDALREGFFRLTASLPGRKSHRLSIHQRLTP